MASVLCRRRPKFEDKGFSRAAHDCRLMRISHLACFEAKSQNRPELVEEQRFLGSGDMVSIRRISTRCGSDAKKAEC